jgi:hypothetical protein
VLTFEENCRNNKHCGTVSLLEGTCTNLNANDSTCSAPFGATASAPSASGGMCAADASANKPMWSWGELAVACTPSAPSGNSCGAGGQCMPSPAMPFEGQFCIMSQDAGACPGGGYSQPRSYYYTTANDTRDCAPCTCGTPTGVDCTMNAQVTLWETNGCDAGVGQPVMPLPSTCVTPAFTMQGATFTTSPAGGSCTPVGGGPIGSIVPQNPMTICCTP